MNTLIMHRTIQLLLIATLTVSSLFAMPPARKGVKQSQLAYNKRYNDLVNKDISNFNSSQEAEMHLKDLLSLKEDAPRYAVQDMAMRFLDTKIKAVQKLLVLNEFAVGKITQLKDLQMALRKEQQNSTQLKEQIGAMQKEISESKSGSAAAAEVESQRAELQARVAQLEKLLKEQQSQSASDEMVLNEYASSAEQEELKRLQKENRQLGDTIHELEQKLLQQSFDQSDLEKVRSELAATVIRLQEVDQEKLALANTIVQHAEQNKLLQEKLKKADEELMAAQQLFSDAVKEKGGQALSLREQQLVKHLAARDTEIKSLRQQVTEASQGDVLKAQEFQQLTEQLTKAESAITDLKKQADQAATLQHQLAHMKQQLADMKSSNEKEVKEKQALEGKVKELQQKLAQLQEPLPKVKVETDVLGELLDAVEKERLTKEARGEKEKGGSKSEEQPDKKLEEVLARAKRTSYTNQQKIDEALDEIRQYKEFSSDLNAIYDFLQIEKSKKSYEELAALLDEEAKNELLYCITVLNNSQTSLEEKFLAAYRLEHGVISAKKGLPDKSELYVGLNEIRKVLDSRKGLFGKLNNGLDVNVHKRFSNFLTRQTIATFLNVLPTKGMDNQFSMRALLGDHVNKAFSLGMASQMEIAEGPIKKQIIYLDEDWKEYVAPLIKSLLTNRLMSDSLVSSSILKKFQAAFAQLVILMEEEKAQIEEKRQTSGKQLPLQAGQVSPGIIDAGITKVLSVIKFIDALPAALEAFNSDANKYIEKHRLPLPSKLTTLTTSSPAVEVAQLVEVLVGDPKHQELLQQLSDLNKQYPAIDKLSEAEVNVLQELLNVIKKSAIQAKIDLDKDQDNKVVQGINALQGKIVLRQADFESLPSSASMW